MKFFKKATLAASVFAGLAISSAAQAQEWSANVGLLSEYHFRGIVQNSTATANGGVDVEAGGFYAGTWVADVEEGLEVDLYAGYGFEFDNGLSLGAGVTTYQYTGDFDTQYDEINLYAGISYFSLEYTIGERDGEAFPDDSYTFTGLTFEYEGLSATAGKFGGDYSGDYVEVGYGTTFEGFDIGVAFILSDSDLDDDETVYFSIAKSFEL
ncbi:TorF family putative porin [Glaciecola sp. 1036]|uniref:TorF family putative porin n=1 Tax=Alteromonadaceae TaxID=72275 RepID=UPI003D04F325